MIKMQYTFEKNCLHKEQKEALFLVELQGMKATAQTKKQLGLNICLAIDISTSMNESVKKNHGLSMLDFSNYIKAKPVQPVWPDIQPNWPAQPHGPWLGVNPWDKNDVPHEIPRPRIVSKMEQAKKAAIEAIGKMNDGDIVSIVAFDDRAEQVYPATKLNSHNRQQIINSIVALRTRGSTDLHAGWVLGATEVAKNLSTKYINRVIVLTDGQTNHGLRDTDAIASNVAKIYQNSISTTTFGIGESFNEDLLEKMANSGAGNFYYVDDDNKLGKMFDDEFSGLSNVAATQVFLKMDFKNAQVVQQFNDIKVQEKGLVLPTINYHGKMAILFKLGVKIKANAKNLNLGHIACTYIDENGNQCEEKIEIKIPVVDKDAYENAPWNEEVKVQETLLTIAQNKTQAIKALNANDLDGAKNILAASASLSAACGFNDMRLSAESQSLSSALLNVGTQNANELKKDMSYQSYKTRYNK